MIGSPMIAGDAAGKAVNMPDLVTDLMVDILHMLLLVFRRWVWLWESSGGAGCSHFD